MTEKRYVPSSEVSAEIKISNSTFISTASPAFSVDEAKEFISQVRVRYSDATHNVPVYIIGHPPSVIEHSNDDGEPSGTAGRPALSILRGSGLGDIAVVITRYFGGTKLGTGGLVRAYSDSMRAVLDKIIRAEKLSTVIAEFTVPYSLFDQIKRIIEQFEGTIIDQRFEVAVSLKIKFKEPEFEPFRDAVISLSKGQIEIVITESIPDDIFLTDES
jgi:uncharacterized YigZ family protein